MTAVYDLGPWYAIHRPIRHQEPDDIGSDPANSYLLAVIAFLAGVAVGWLLATIRLKGTIEMHALPVDTGSGTGKRKTRTMEIKCGCGSLLKFRDPVELGYQPYPRGDSVTCPNCERVTNERNPQTRKRWASLEQIELADLFPKNIDHHGLSCTKLRLVAKS